VLGATTDRQTNTQTDRCKWFYGLLSAML